MDVIFKSNLKMQELWILYVEQNQFVVNQVIIFASNLLVLWVQCLELPTTFMFVFCSFIVTNLEKTLFFFSGKQKRLRLTSTSTVEELKPFEQLKSLDVYLKSPAHMPIFQLLVNQCKNLEVLKFDQFYCDYEESLINRSLFEWNPLHTLKTLSIGKKTFFKV